MHLIPLIAILLLQACVTGGFSNDNEGMVVSETPAPPAKKAPDQEPAEVPAAVPAPDPAVANREWAFGFYERALQKDYVLIPDDAQHANALVKQPLTQPKHLGEACLVLFAAHTVLAGLSQQKPFNERDITDPENKLVSLLTLEQEAQKLGIDIAQGLRTNSLLKNLDIIQLLQESLDVSSDTAPYKESLRALLVSTKDRSPVVAPVPAVVAPAVVAPIVTKPAPAGVTTPVEPIPAPPAVPGVAAVPPPPAPPKDNQDLVLNAQRLLDQKNYKEAIQLLKTVEPNDLRYAEAQAKIKKVSSLAIGELRRSAATDFQKALTINDPKAKTLYLKNAQQMLQTAIASFPDAEQIDTVKQNLQVINKNLEYIGRN